VNEFQKRIGVGEPCRAFGKLAGTTRTRPVVTEEGPTRGTVGGAHIDHWDGRVDAVVSPPTVKASIPTTKP
jgi:hypothetical protein